MLFSERIILASEEEEEEEEEEVEKENQKHKKKITKQLGNKNSILRSTGIFKKQIENYLTTTEYNDNHNNNYYINYNNNTYITAKHHEHEGDEFEDDLYKGYNDFNPILDTRVSEMK